MENILSKIAVFIICAALSSCAFDGKNIEVLSTINEHYYALNDASADYGLQIGYSLDNQTYQIIASYCDNIYYNKDTIMYSERAFRKDSTLSFYIIPINPKKKNGLANDPIKIKERIFQGSIGRFNKVNIPNEKK